MIGLGCRVADSLGFEFVPNPECESYQLLLGLLPDPVRQRMPVDPNELASRITDKVSCIESMRPPSPVAARGDQRKTPPVRSLGQPLQTDSAHAHRGSH